MADLLSPLDPFRTVARHHRDFNRSDEATELAQALQRDELIEQLITGEGYLDTALDCLAEQGIDPDAWIDATVTNMAYVVDAGVRFEPTETGLLLPTLMKSH